MRHFPLCIGTIGHASAIPLSLRLLSSAPVAYIVYVARPEMEVPRPTLNLIGLVVLPVEPEVKVPMLAELVSTLRFDDLDWGIPDDMNFFKKNWNDRNWYETQWPDKRAIYSSNRPSRHGHVFHRESRCLKG